MLRVLVILASKTNGMSFTFREGSIEDKDQLKELALASYGQFERVLTKDNWHKLHENLKSESSYEDILAVAKCFVCEVEGRLAGVAYLVPSGNPTEIYDSNWSYIRMVGVDPAYRGNGIGSRLTLSCIAYARQSGEQIVALHTSEFMDSARHIYEGLGFIREKELKPIFGKRYWLYQMELTK